MGILRLNDITAPAIFISSPTFAPALETSATTIDIAGSVTDDRLVARVAWSNDSGGGGTGTLSGENWSVDAIPLNPGPNEITVTAVDSSGNLSQDVITVTRMLAVRQNQTLSFGTVADQSFGGVPVILTATSSAGLPVSFSVVTGPAIITGSVLTLTGAGTVSVRASQPGNWAYNAAAPVERTFSAGKATQQIAWTAIDDQVLSGAPLMLHAQATSGQLVDFSVVSGPATVTGNQCNLTGQGEVILRAAQSGNLHYTAAAADISFVVLGAPQTISFGALAQQLAGASAFPLAGTSSSGIPVTFSIVSGPAVIIEGLLHVTGPGLVIVRASAEGSTTIAPAYVEQAFAVVPGVNIITDQQAMESGHGYFRFWGEQGRLYEIQRSSNLQGWVTEETLSVNGLGYIDYIHSLPTDGQKLFYRVKERTESLVTPPPGMGYIPAGAFQMGDSFNEGGAAELPVHPVQVAAFFMDQHEVSRELWDDVRSWGGTHGYVIGNANSAGPGHPIYSNTWDDAVKWCNARSEKEGLTPCYYDSPTKTSAYRSGSITISPDMVDWGVNGYRLPTEAEWEKAARGGQQSMRYPWGDNAFSFQANYWQSGDPFEGSPIGTSPVGYYNGQQTPAGTDMANGYGLYDMAGNVWEQCFDWFMADAYSAAWATGNPRGPSTPQPSRVLRGGGYTHGAEWMRVAARISSGAPGPNGNIGFRCVRSLIP